MREKRPVGVTISRTDDRIFLGIGGLYASPGDHLGHFYSTREEWKEVAIPFLETGLAAGDKCVYLCRSPDQREILEALADRGVDVEGASASGQLVLDEGKAKPEELRDWLNQLSTEVRERHRLLRWGGDMSWSVDKLASSEALMEWETMCNLMEGPPGLFLCQYDLSQFLGNVVMDALKTHPLCIIGKVIHQNSFYMKPEEFLEELRGRAVNR